MNFNHHAQDPYSLLGVSKDAPFSDIRKAYFTKVKEYHPDQFQNLESKKQAEENLKLINIAFDAIKQSKGLKKSVDEDDGDFKAQFFSMSLQEVDHVYHQAMEEILDTESGQRISKAIDDYLAKKEKNISLSKKLMTSGCLGLCLSTAATFSKVFEISVSGSLGILLSGGVLLAGMNKSRKEHAIPYKLHNLEEALHQMALKRMREKITQSAKHSASSRGEHPSTQHPTRLPA